MLTRVRRGGEGRNRVTMVQLSQVWMATICLDPALCREIVRHLRAFGDLFAEEPSDDPDLWPHQAAFGFLADVARAAWERLAPRAGVIVNPALAHDR